MITNVLEYLENSATKYPEKTAFADPASHCSYQEALQASRSIGSALLPFDQRRRPMAVLIDRDVCSVLAFSALYSAAISMYPLTRNFGRAGSVRS